MVYKPMTFSEYLRFGHVSRLGEIECKGPSESVANTQNQLTQQQLGAGTQQQQFSNEDRARGMALQQPLITQQTALASGDRNAAVAAAMPTISQISAGYKGAHDSIFNNLAPGAGRDAALASLEVQKYTGQAGAMASQVQRAPEILANLGSGLGAFSLQELGAGLSGFSGASTSNMGAGKLGADQSKAKWEPIVGLAGAAGTAAGGIFSDRRLKQNVTGLGLALKAIAMLPIVKFEYNSLGAVPPSRTKIGVIAQDVQELFPEAVSTSGQYLAVDYSMLAAVALKGIQELTAELAAAVQRLDWMEKRLAKSEAYNASVTRHFENVADAMESIRRIH